MQKTNDLKIHKCMYDVLLQSTDQCKQFLKTNTSISRIHSVYSTGEISKVATFGVILSLKTQHRTHVCNICLIPYKS